MVRVTGSPTFTSKRRRPVQRGRLYRSGNRMVKQLALCGCTAPLCGFVDRATGKRSKAGSAVAPCSEVVGVRVRVTGRGL